MKGDGWAVHRYICPVCKRKGVYAHYYSGQGVKFTCMYRKRHESYIEGYYNNDFNTDEVYNSNPELKDGKVSYKAGKLRKY